MSSSLGSLTLSDRPPQGATWHSFGEDAALGARLIQALSLDDVQSLLRLMRLPELPEFSLMWKVAEPIEHHPEGDVGTHMELVMARAFELSSELPVERKLRVRMMALTHDLGKVVTGSQRPSGRGQWVVADPTRAARHPGHDYLGIDLVFSLFRRLSLPTGFLDCSAQFANYHQAIHQLCSRSGQLGAGSVALAISLMATPKGDRFGLQAWRLALKNSELTSDVAMAAQSDAQGRAFPMEEMMYPQAELLRRLQSDCQSQLAGTVLNEDSIRQETIQTISHCVRKTLNEWKEELPAPSTPTQKPTHSPSPQQPERRTGARPS